MGRFLATITLLVAIIVAIGLYRGWFIVRTSDSPDQSEIKVKVDKDAVRQDSSDAQTRAADLGQHLKQDISPTSQPSTSP